LWIMKTMRKFRTPIVWLLIVAMVASVGMGFIMQFAGI
jgi:hypothetical protein